MNATKLHRMLAERIVDCIEIADQLSISDPCSSTIGAKGLLRQAYALTTDRAAALRILGQVERRPSERPALSDILRGIQAARARQPRIRRSPLAKLFGS